MNVHEDDLIRMVVFLADVGRVVLAEHAKHPAGSAALAAFRARLTTCGRYDLATTADAEARPMMMDSYGLYLLLEAREDLPLALIERVADYASQVGGLN